MEKLEPHQVFVFGSNGDGFHGAGAAGQAMRGNGDANWRGDAEFLKAKVQGRGAKGKWAQYGVGRGYQEGREGSSYAIQTVTRPGQRRSVSLEEIGKQLQELGEFARKNPEKEFLMSKIATGLAGYSEAELKVVLGSLDLPENVKLPKSWRKTSK